MSAAKNSRLQLEKKETLGLLANGVSGSWEVAIDETSSGPDRWFAHIEGPTVCFYFEVPSPNIVEVMLQFLKDGTKKGHNKSTKGNGLLHVGKDKGMPVTLVRDDEYADRYFLVIGPENRPMVRFTFAGADLTSFVRALRQAKEDIEER